MSNETKKPSIKTILFIGYIANITISLIIIKFFSNESYLVAIFKAPNYRNIFISLLFVFLLELLVFLFIKYKGLTIKGNEDTNNLLEMYSTIKIKKIISHSILTSASEELLFRVALLGVLTIYLNIYLAVLISIILFVLSHAKQYCYDPYSLIIIAFLGFFTSWSFLIETSIWGPILIHLIHNVMTIIWIKNGFLAIR